MRKKLTSLGFGHWDWDQVSWKFTGVIKIVLLLHHTVSISHVGNCVPKTATVDFTKLAQIWLSHLISRRQFLVHCWCAMHVKTSARKYWLIKSLETTEQFCTVWTQWLRLC